MNILIVRPDGIGDEILSLPVATALRRLLPDSRLIFLSSAYAAPVLWHHPDIDEILTLEGGESLRDLVRLFRSGIHAALFLKPFRKLIVAAWLAGVPVRVGTGYRWYSWLLNRRVYEHRSDFSKHESLYNLGLLRGLGLSPGDVVSPPRLTLTSQEQRWAATFLGPPTTRIVVHPGGFSSRTWKAAQFRDLVVRLARDGYEILLTGSQVEGERFRSETGMTEIPTAVRDLMGTLNLRELMAVMAALVTRQSPPRADCRNEERPKAGSGKPMAADSPSTKTRRFVSGSGRTSGLGVRAIARGNRRQPNFSLVACPVPVRRKNSGG